MRARLRLHLSGIMIVAKSDWDRDRPRLSWIEWAIVVAGSLIALGVLVAAGYGVTLMLGSWIRGG